MPFPSGLLSCLLVTEGGLFTQLGTWIVWVLNLYPIALNAMVAQNENLSKGHY